MATHLPPMLVHTLLHPQTRGVEGAVIKRDLRYHLVEAGRAPANVLGEQTEVILRGGGVEWRGEKGEESAIPPD